VGQVLAVRRRGRPVGSCRVEALSTHRATCAGEDLRVGDTVLFDARSAAAAPPVRAPKELPEVLPAAALARQRALVGAARFEPVVSKHAPPGAGLARAMRVDVTATHQSWVTRGGGAGFHQERLDVRLAGPEVWRGFSLYLDASAIGWTGRPSTSHFPSTGRAHLLVREANLTGDAPGAGGLVLSAGRLWPRGASSLGVLDGAQVGWRSGRSGAEVGAFAGGLPEQVLLRPSLEQPVMGAYATYVRARPEGLVRWWQQELQVAWLPSDAQASRLVLGTLARAAFRGRLDAGLDVRAGLGGEEGAGLQAVRLDVGARPSERLQLSAGARYEDTGLDLLLPAAGGLPTRLPRWSADLRTQYALSPRASLALSGGSVVEAGTSPARMWMGPELVLPGLLGRRSELSVGHQEEAGLLGSRNSWVQAQVRPLEALGLLVRGSWFDEHTDIDGQPVRWPEAGLYTSVEWRLARRLSLRASALGRTALGTLPPAADGASLRPGGLVAMASLSGSL
jgi:hypothetical protein